MTKTARGRSERGRGPRKAGQLIYYVIPRELGDEYFEEFKKRFADVEDVEVIVDRRQGERRAHGDYGGKRVLRDRRRRRAPGTFPEV